MAKKTTTTASAAATPGLSVRERIASLTCPEWCNGTHLQYYLDDPDLPLEDVLEHFGSGPAHRMPVLQNVVDGRVMRPGGGGWDLILRQECFDVDQGWYEKPVVELDVNAKNDDAYDAVFVRLTSGEARVLAAQLVMMADKIDR